MSKAWTKADTMTVVLEDSKSIGISIQLGPEQDDLDNYTNATLRFDQGDHAVICGLPRNWAIWDTPINTCDDDSNDCEEYFGDTDLLERLGYDFKYERVDEYNTLLQVRKAFLNQTKDPMFRGRISVEKKLAIITLIDRALARPEFAFIRKAA